MWDLDLILDKVWVAELPQNLVGGDGGNLVHFVDGIMGVAEQSKASLVT